MSDPYVYLGTSVLINHFDIRDERELQQVERLITSSQFNPLPELTSLTPAGYSNLHKHIFGRLYPWAGEFRTVPIAKPQALFCLPQFIEPQLENCFSNISDDKDLLSSDYKTFSHALAEHLSQLDAIHPFREGNGRTMRLFIETFALQRGIPFNTKHLSREAWMDASITVFKSGDTTLMQKLLHTTIEKTTRANELDKYQRQKGNIEKDNSLE